MSKRFSIKVDENRDVHILDNGIDRGLYRVCDLLNRLYEENQALKIKIEELEEEFYEYEVINGYLE